MGEAQPRARHVSEHTISPMIRPSSVTGRMMSAPLPLNEILSKDGPLSRRNTAKKCIASPKRKAIGVAIREKMSDLLFMDYLFHLSVFYHVDVYWWKMRQQVCST